MTEILDPVVRRVSDLELNDCLSAIIYSLKGAGKTWFAGTAGDRTVFFTIGSSITGLKTLRSPLFREKVESNPFVEEIHEKLNKKRVPEKATAFDNLCRRIDWWTENRLDDFDTVVIDDCTNTKRSALYKGFEINAAASLSKGWEKLQEHGIPMPGVQDFGQEMNLMQWLMETYIEILLGLGKNFLVLAHERYTFSKPKDSQNRVIVGDKDIVDKIRPAFTGRTMPDDITVNFDEVWHMTKIGTGNAAVHKLDCYGDNQILASTRHGGIFKPTELNPNFKEMMSRIKNATQKPYKILSGKKVTT